MRWVKWWRVLVLFEYQLVYTHTHTHPFNGHFSGTTQVSRYQKGRTNLDFTEAKDNEWQWHQLGQMQVCTLLQTSIPPLKVFYRPDALPATQPTASKHWISNYSIGKKLNFPISCANLHFNLVWFLVCMLVMTVSAPKMAEPIELLFGGRLVWIKPCITRLGPCWQIGGLQV